MIKECLLVDDDTDDQEIFLMAIQQVDPNIRCTVAPDGEDALTKLKGDTSYTPDYIFLDVNMHKISGLECLREIKKLEHLRDTRIIIFSTSPDPQIVAKKKELGIDDFLTKPPGFSLLCSELRKIMESSNT